MCKLHLCGLTLAVGALMAGSASAQLTGVVTEDGLISSSTSANGNNDSGGGLLDVMKPNATATVRSAYMAAATFGNYMITSTGVTLSGMPVTWSNHASNGFFENFFTEVTSIVATIVDIAPAGLIQLPVTEGPNTGNIDGIRCVGQGVPFGLYRYSVSLIGANGTLVLGPGVVGISQNFPAGGAIQLCQTWNFQCVYRDDHAAQCNTGSNSSNAIGVTFGL